MLNHNQALQVRQPEINHEYDDLKRSLAMEAANELLARIPEGAYDPSNIDWQGVTMTPVRHSGEFSEQLDDQRLNIIFMFGGDGNGLSVFQISCKDFGIGQLSGEQPSVIDKELGHWTKRIDTNAWRQTTEQIQGFLNGDMVIARDV